MDIIIDPKKILIVKLNLLGDTICFLPTICAIRKKWPEAQLTLLTTNIGKEIIEDCKLADKVWVAPIREIKTLHGFFRWLRIIKNNKFDLAIASSDSSSFISLLFFLSKIPLRVGFTNPKLSFMFNIRIPFSKSITHTDLNLRVAELFGLQNRQTKPKWNISISDVDKKYVLKVLHKSEINNSDRFLTLHIGSNRPSHRWSIERVAEVVKFIEKEYSMKVVCIGGKQEQKMISTLKEFCGENSNIIDVTCKTNIKQLIYLISLSSLFIGHSSGPLHIAYMMGTPTISFWGASSLLIWGPAWEKEKHKCIKVDLDCLYCEQDVCPKGTLECMEQISVDMVVKEVEKLLRRLV